MGQFEYFRKQTFQSLHSSSLSSASLDSESKEYIIFNNYTLDIVLNIFKHRYLGLQSSLSIKLEINVQQCVKSQKGSPIAH